MTLFAVFPIILFTMALLAIVSGLAVFWTLRQRQGGIFTGFVWSVFAGSICTGFMTFALFVYITQDNLILAFGVGLVGILAVMSAGRLATL